MFAVHLADGSGHQVESADDLRRFLVARGLVTEDRLRGVDVMKLSEGDTVGQRKGAAAILYEPPAELAQVPQSERWDADDWQRYQRIAQRAYEHGLFYLPDAEPASKLVALRAKDLSFVAEEPIAAGHRKPVLATIGYLVAKATPRPGQEDP